MTIKGPPIDSTQTGEVLDASAAVDEEALMPSVCPGPLTTPAPLSDVQQGDGSAPAASSGYGTALRALGGGRWRPACRGRIWRR